MYIDPTYKVSYDCKIEIGVSSWAVGGEEWSYCLGDTWDVDFPARDYDFDYLFWTNGDRYGDGFYLAGAGTDDVAGDGPGHCCP